MKGMYRRYQLNYIVYQFVSLGKMPLLSMKRHKLRHWILYNDIDFSEIDFVDSAPHFGDVGERLIRLTEQTRNQVSKKSRHISNKLSTILSVLRCMYLIDRVTRLPVDNRNNNITEGYN